MRMLPGDEWSGTFVHRGNQRKGGSHTETAGELRSGASQHKACAISAAAADSISRRGRLNHRVLVGAEEIALADLDASVAQKAVGGRGVEIEVRQRVRTQELLAPHGEGLVGTG